jgi:hypothetical protein
LQDNIFKGTKITSAYQVLPEYQGLKWLDNNERANLLERTQVNSLRVGFVLPILHFTWAESFANLTPPDAYYVVVTAEFQDNSTRLALAYKNPACNRTLPPGLTFGARAEAYSVVAMADAAICGNILDAHVLAALESHARAAAGAVGAGSSSCPPLADHCPVCPFVLANLMLFSVDALLPRAELNVTRLAALEGAFGLTRHVDAGAFAPSLLSPPAPPAPPGLAPAVYSQPASGPLPPLGTGPVGAPLGLYWGPLGTY